MKCFFILSNQLVKKKKCLTFHLTEMRETFKT